MATIVMSSIKGSRLRNTPVTNKIRELDLDSKYKGVALSYLSFQKDPVSDNTPTINEYEAFWVGSFIRAVKLSQAQTTIQLLSLIIQCNENDVETAFEVLVGLLLLE